MARLRSAKPPTAVRIRSRPLFFFLFYYSLIQPQYSFKQERANIFSHVLGILFFFSAGFYLLYLGILAAKANSFTHTNIVLGSFLIVAVTSLMTYVSSVHYHASPLKTRTAYRKWDHISIFWSIAGFYLPFIALYYDQSGRKFWLLFIVMGLAIAGTLFKIFFLHVNKYVYTAIYLLMGWMIVFFGKDFLLSLPLQTIILLIAGGLSYTIGVFFYLQKKWYYSHAIWHIFVLIGGICHYFSILSYLIANISDY